MTCMSHLLFELPMQHDSYVVGMMGGSGGTLNCFVRVVPLTPHPPSPTPSPPVTHSIPLPPIPLQSDTRMLLNAIYFECVFLSAHCRKNMTATCPSEESVFFTGLAASARAHDQPSGRGSDLVV